jgi:hypothetical protein
MARSKRNKVSMSVDKGFFDNIFEPARKKAEKQIGTKVTQAKFTAMLKNSGLSLDLRLGGLDVPKRKKR